MKKEQVIHNYISFVFEGGYYWKDVQEWKIYANHNDEVLYKFHTGSLIVSYWPWLIIGNFLNIGADHNLSILLKKWFEENTNYDFFEVIKSDFRNQFIKDQVFYGDGTIYE